MSASSDDQPKRATRERRSIGERESKRPASARDIEGLLEDLDAVVSAQVLLGRDGAIGQVRVLVWSEQEQTSARKEVERLLSDKGGAEPGSYELTLSALEQLLREGLAEDSMGRVRFEKVSCHVSRDGRQAQVKLTIGGEQKVGEANPQTDATDAPSLAAEATLHALHDLVPKNCRLSFMGLERSTAKGIDVALSVVNFTIGQRSLDLVGCAPISGEVERAAVFATLDAVNRLVEPHLQMSALDRASESLDRSEENLRRTLELLIHVRERLEKL